jgi:hypothetical protein
VNELMKEASQSEALLYTVQVFKYFQTRCGKTGTLTMDDWSCIQQWREQGLEVDSIRRGIDRACMENGGTIRSLADCAKSFGNS